MFTVITDIEMQHVYVYNFYYMLQQKLYAYNRTLHSGDKANPIST